jgi:hypothetical protein
MRFGAAHQSAINKFWPSSLIDSCQGAGHRVHRCALYKDLSESRKQLLKYFSKLRQE